MSNTLLTKCVLLHWLTMENLGCVCGTKNPFCLLSFHKTKALLESVGESHLILLQTLNNPPGNYSSVEWWYGEDPTGKHTTPHGNSLFNIRFIKEMPSPVPTENIALTLPWPWYLIDRKRNNILKKTRIKPHEFEAHLQMWNHFSFKASDMLTTLM